MKPFKYAIATSEDGACQLLGEKSLALAGGTNVLNLMKDYVLQPEVLVDIKGIDGLNVIEPIDGGVRIGANVTLTEILKSELVTERYPALTQAIAEDGTPQVRNRGTLGGNLCARPACWYFIREGFDCAKGSGTGCAAKEGQNEFHAIFDTRGPCVMVHPSSAAPALIVLEARVRIASPKGSREILLEEFFTSPKQDIRRENVLAPNEIVTHVTLGAPNVHSATYEVRQKAAHDWPISTASVALEQSFGVCKKARICLGAVAPVPKRVPTAENRLEGQRITEAVASAAATGAIDRARPLSQNDYKMAATRAAVRRAVLLAATGKWS